MPSVMEGVAGNEGNRDAVPRVEGGGVVSGSRRNCSRMGAETVANDLLACFRLYSRNGG